MGLQICFFSWFVKSFIIFQFDPITDPLGICAGGPSLNGNMTPNPEAISLKRRASEEAIDNPMIKKFILS